MQIYLHKDNQQLGPFTEADIRAQLAAGTIAPQDHVWWQGQATWLPVGQTPLGQPTVPGVTLVSRPMPNGLPVGAMPSHTSQLAIWSLVCGCLSLFCWPFTSIPAILLGHLGLSETKKNPALQGRGMALAGMVLGYIFTTLVVLYFICIVVFVALGSQVQEMFKTITSQLNAQAANGNSSSDDSTTNSDSSTNAPDSSTNSPTATPQ